MSDKRIRCRLLGCEPGISLLPECFRCGSHIYSHEFIQSGWLYPLQRLRWLVPATRCAECRRLLPPWKWWNAFPMCSIECFDKWLPF